MAEIASEFNEAITTGEINPETAIPEAKSFRGQGVALALLDKVRRWSRENGFRNIYLGTMKQFKAAQRFYEKNHFVRISKTELSEFFIHNPLDDVFFRSDLVLN